jgi:anaerobic selenocysteine-containing dehydrogenase
VLDEPGPGGSLARLGLETPIDCVPGGLRPALERAHKIFRELRAEPPEQLKLVTRRTAAMLNSAFQNVEVLKGRGAATNPLWMSPDDAARLSLEAGEIVRVANGNGLLHAELRLDANLRAGVVAMTHGFGNAGTSGMPVAQAHPGVNVNVLAPAGAGSFDPVSGMSQVTGIPVEVTRAPT